MNSKNRLKGNDLAVVIAPFTGNLHVLAKTAVAELVKEGFCKILEIDRASPHRLASCDILLVEDGYTPSLHKELLTKQLGNLNHHLILSNLGLDEDADINRENIDLVKDGIEAESIVVDSYTPQFNCPCCSNA